MQINSQESYLGHTWCSDPPPENENPGALAGATGANFEGSLGSETYNDRLVAATALCFAIRACHPSDAVFLMAAALEDLRAGMPIPALDSIMAEARLWAEWATPPEAKAYALAAFEAMGSRDRAAFLAYVTPRAAA